MTTHTDECVHPPHSPREDCEYNNGSWNQPPGWLVDAALGRLPDDAPWCRVQRLAWELADCDAMKSA